MQYRYEADTVQKWGKTRQDRMADAIGSHLVIAAGHPEAEVQDVIDISWGRFPILAKGNLPNTTFGDSGERGVVKELPPSRALESGSFLLSPGFKKLPPLGVVALFVKEVQLLPEQAGLLKHLQKPIVRSPERNLVVLPDLDGADAAQDLDMHKIPVKPSTPRLPAYQGTLSALRRLVVTQYAIR